MHLFRPTARHGAAEAHLRSRDTFDVVVASSADGVPMTWELWPARAPMRRRRARAVSAEGVPTPQGLWPLAEHPVAQRVGAIEPAVFLGEQRARCARRTCTKPHTRARASDLDGADEPEWCKSLAWPRAAASPRRSPCYAPDDALPLRTPYPVASPLPSPLRGSCHDAGLRCVRRRGRCMQRTNAPRGLSAHKPRRAAVARCDARAGAVRRLDDATGRARAPPWLVSFRGSCGAAGQVYPVIYFESS